jgi:hypothetical protein
MPTCCPQIEVSFTNESSTTIAYTALMQQQFGNTPRVFVWYYDSEADEYYLSNAFFTRVAFVGGNVIVDHGGPNTGFVVIR